MGYILYLHKSIQNFDTTLYELLAGSLKKPYEVNKQTRSPINTFPIYFTTSVYESYTVASFTAGFLMHEFRMSVVLYSTMKWI